MRATDFSLLRASSQTVGDVVERLGPCVSAVQVGPPGAAAEPGDSGLLADAHG